SPSCTSDTGVMYCVGGSADRTDGGSLPAAVHIYTTRPAQDPDGPSQALDGSLHVTSVDPADKPTLENEPVATERRLATARLAGRVMTTEAKQSGSMSIGVPGVLSNGVAGDDCASMPGAIISSSRAKCHATATTVALDPTSASYGSTVTVTAIVTDSSDSPAPLANAVAFDDNGAGGTFSAGACRAEQSALACSTNYSTPNAGKQVTITVTHEDALHTRSLTNAALTLTGSSSTITVTSPATPAVAAEAIHFTAGISPVDGGSGKVAFDVDGVALQSPKAQVASDSRATSGTTSTLSVGIHIVTAAFSGGVSLNEKVGVIAPGVGTMAQQVIGELEDELSCWALGGRWTAHSETCTVSSLIVDQTNSFQIDRGVTLASLNGTITINQGGLIVNRGRMTNSGRQEAARPSTITVNSGGRLVNFGSFSNQTIVLIDQGATVTNRGAILNDCGDTAAGSGIVSGAVSGAPPVNRCDAPEREKRRDS